MRKMVITAAAAERRLQKRTKQKDEGNKEEAKSTEFGVN